MNQVIMWLRSGSSLVRRLSALRQTLTVFLVGIVLLSSVYSNAPQTLIQSLAPAAATSLRVGAQSGQSENSQALAEPQQKLKGAANNVREKLNLDEPLYSPTKEFLDSSQKGPKQAFKKTREAIEDTSNPVKGDRSR